MKLFPLFALTLLSFPAFADEPPMPPTPPPMTPGQQIDQAWDDIDYGVEGTVDAFMTATRDAIHDRPELQMIPHLVLLRKRDEVKIAYCRSAVGQLFRDRKAHPSKNNCDEVLTRGSLNLHGLEACVAHRAGSSDEARNLQRELARVGDRQNNDYNYDYLGIHDPTLDMNQVKQDYRHLFRTCAAEIARKEPKPAAKPMIPPAPKPEPSPAMDVVPEQQPAADAPPVEFHPVDHSGDEAPPPASASGTL